MRSEIIRVGRLRLKIDFPVANVYDCKLVKYTVLEADPPICQWHWSSLRATEVFLKRGRFE